MMIKTSNGEYKIGGIYKHFRGNYYMIRDIGKLHESQNIFLIVYNQCDINGVYSSIRENIGTDKETIVFQPFITDETRWCDEVEFNGIKTKRFELIK